MTVNQIVTLKLLCGLTLILTGCGGLKAVDLSSVSGSASCEKSIENSYLMSVKPIFETKNCASCHGTGGSAENTRFQFGPGIADKTSIESVYSLVNVEAIGESTLLKKPTNSVAHSGGKLFDVTSPEYRSIEAFISVVGINDFCQLKNSCTPQQEVASKKVRRLSSDQLSKVLRSIYGNYTGDKINTKMFTVSSVHTGFDNDSSRLTVDPYTFRLWRDSVFSNVGRVRNHNALYLNSSCRDSMITDACLNHAFENVAEKLIRRPVSTEMKTEIRASLKRLEVAGLSAADQWDAFNTYFLLSPSFLYRAEVGFLGQDTDNLFQLDDYEIASFLSFTLLDGPPDSQLYDKAKKGELINQVELVNQVNRLTGTQSAKDMMVTYLKDLLKVGNIETDDGKKYTDFAKWYVRKYFGPAFNSMALWTYEREIARRRDLQNETDRYIERKLGNSLEYNRIFSGTDYDVSFRSAPFFGVIPSVLDTYPADRSEIVVKNFSSDERHGILTHPAFLASHSNPTNSGMVKRGVFTIEQLLCNELPAAPAEVNAAEEEPPGFDPTKLTNRQKFEALHSQQTACFFCHQTIDNVGGAYENFSNLGYFSTEETFQYEGSEYRVDVDSSGELNGIGNLDINYADGVEFAKKLTSTNHFKTCMNQRLQEYIVGENKTKDNKCFFEKVDKSLSKSTQPNLKNMLLNLVNSVTALKRK